jgi:predicted dehydrogenase
MHTLLILEPGHFHAALLLKRRDERIAPDVHLYASPSPERDAFTELVASFNSRERSPTAWRVHRHDARDRDAALASLMAERRGDIVVIAGRNSDKLDTIATLHEAGFWVLADKPWLTGAASLQALARSCRGGPLASDIMPDRHELLARLRKRVVDTPQLFGTFTVDDPKGAAIELGSTHHLCKRVDGRALRRPPWYYDVHAQGDGMVDVQAHLTDQAQWLVDEALDYDFDRDVRIESARRWTTPVPPELFHESTGESAYPPALAPWIRDGVLHYPCNGEINYRLCGVSVRQVADWGQREPEGGGDLHRACLRGTRAVLTVRHGPQTGYVPEVHLAPRPGAALGDALADTVAALQDEFPGLGAEPTADGFRFTAPAALHTTHESHFAKALSEFLDHVDAGHWPDALQMRLRTRYRLLAEARELALAAAGELEPDT